MPLYAFPLDTNVPAPNDTSEVNIFQPLPKHHNGTTSSPSAIANASAMFMTYLTTSAQNRMWELGASSSETARVSEKNQCSHMLPRSPRCIMCFTANAGVGTRYAQLAETRVRRIA